MTFQEFRLLQMLTQEEMAEKLNVATSTIAHWESGRNRPFMQHRKKIMAVFGLSREEVLRMFPYRPRRPRQLTLTAV